MLQGLFEVYPNCDVEEASSLLSGLLNAAFGLGQALGPFLGAVLN